VARLACNIVRLPNDLGALTMPREVNGLVGARTCMTI